jgi:uncharacterized membrane protein YphA (DoxX/SURF4 family)
VSWTVVWQSAVGVVLLVAGIGKVVAPGSLLPFLTALGLPAAAARLTGYALPLVEIMCGGLLLAGVRPWPARGTLVLSVVFLGTLWVARRAGVSVGCRCFGALDSATLTPVALVRAAGLVVLAGWVVAAQWTGAAAPLTPPQVLAGAAAAFVFLIGSALLGKVYEFESGRREVAR